MILIIYKREEVIDMRSFRDEDELNDWIKAMNELGEEFKILYREVN